MRRPALLGGLLVGAALGAGALTSLPAQELTYAPPQGASFRFRTTNTLTVSQRVLERENHYTLRSGGLVRLTLLSPEPRLLWRMGFDELSLRIEGAFPTPRIEALRGTVVTLATTPQGVVLDALTAGVVTPGLGARYLERAAAAFFPHLPNGGAGSSASWTDTLTLTDVLQGVTAEVRSIVTYRATGMSALAGRPMVPIEYRGRLTVSGAGTVQGSRIALSGTGAIEGHYLYDPAARMFALHVQEQVLESTLTLDSPAGPPVAIPSRQVLRARAERLY
ncbi:MAG: hypothetical protein ABR559_07480 [Gemmatimonadota bacterium]